MEERYAFLAEWYDPNASLIRKYQLLCYPKDNSCEMYDIKNRRLFLKRSVVNNLKVEDIFIGSVVNVHSRQLSIVDFGDECTTKKLKSKKEKTVVIIKPECVEKAGEILKIANAADLRICNARMVQLSAVEAQELCQGSQGMPQGGNVARQLSSAPVVAVEMTGDSAVSKWLALLGPDNSAQARRDAPESIRARFGTDAVNNACLGSHTAADAQRESEFFFGPKARGRSPATCKDSTLCIVKPHAVLSGQTGEILSAVKEAGFGVAALALFYVEKANAEEFYEVYKGVVTEYVGMVEELCSGPCIALEIKGREVHASFRGFVGPPDPEIARHLRPHTLRAKFGKDKIQNTVHCTDLPDDCNLEVEYFFRILSS